MTRIALVSSADARYYPLLREWVAAIRSFKQSAGMDICIIDAGLKTDQLRALQPHVTKVVEPDWPEGIPARKAKGRTWLKACVSRPFIPELFPDYDAYLWMDADTWVQDWSAVSLLLKATENKALAIVPQADRAYGKAMRISWLGPFLWRARSFYYSNAKKAFSGRIARQMFPYPTLNAGVFALRADAPHWERWQELIRKAVKRGKLFTAEQLTLGMMVYLEQYKAQLLPAWCNWLCETKPCWDGETGKFIEPYLPNRQIGIMHLSGYDDMRVNRAEGTDVPTLDEEEVFLSLRYPFYDGEQDREVLFTPEKEPPFFERMQIVRPLPQAKPLEPESEEEQESEGEP